MLATSAGEMVEGTPDMPDAPAPANILGATEAAAAVGNIEDALAAASVEEEETAAEEAAAGSSDEGPPNSSAFSLRTELGDILTNQNRVEDK